MPRNTDLLVGLAGQMPRLGSGLDLRDPQYVRVHRVDAHDRDQLHEAALAIAGPNRVERRVGYGGLLQELPPEANDQRFLGREPVQRPVRVDGVQRLLTRPLLEAEPRVRVPDVVAVRRPRGYADRELSLRVTQRRVVAQVLDEVGQQGARLLG